MIRPIRSLFSAVTVAVFVAGPTAALADDHPLHGVALVIGESDYAEPLQKLDNPKRDARAMDDLLDSLGFHVDRILDVDHTDMQEALAKFVRDAKGADVALVYYSGHGVEAAGGDFLVPLGADLSSPQAAGASLLPVSDLLDELARTVPVTIMLLDACRTNSFPPGQLVQLPGTDAAVPVAPSGLEALRGPTPVATAGVSPDSLGTVIGFAASPGEPALDGDPGGNSPYAAALLKHFAAGGYSFGDVMTLVSEEVYLKTHARQQPWMNTSLRRVLNFGTPVTPVAGEDADILAGRRSLLLTIATEPEETRHYVESVASTEGVPLDALFGMLKELGINSSGRNADLQDELAEGARRLKEFMAHQPAAIPGDADLQKFADLAMQAQNEGAMDLAMHYRAQESGRGTILAAQLKASDEKNAEDSKAAHRAVAASFADYARTAMLTFDFTTAAQQYSLAYDQIAGLDAEAAVTYKRGQAEALREFGRFKGDNQSLLHAIDAYREAAALVATSSADWLDIEEGLGVAEWRLGSFEGEQSMLHEALATLGGVIDAASGAANRAVRARAQVDLGNAYWRLGERGSGADQYAEAAAAFESGLDLLSLQSEPFDWASAQSGLGQSLWRIGFWTNDVPMLNRALDALRAAQQVWTPTADERDWAATQVTIGGVYDQIARVENDSNAMRPAIAAYDEVLATISTHDTPLIWATIQHNKGSAERWAAEHDGNVPLMQSAIDALQTSLTIRSPSNDAVSWAKTETELGRAQLWLGTAQNDTATLVSAATAFRAALTVNTMDGVPLLWWADEDYLARALSKLATLAPNGPYLGQAIAEYRSILAAPAGAIAPADLARMQDRLSAALLSLGIRSADRASLTEAATLAHKSEAAYAALGQDYAKHFRARQSAVSRALAALN